MNFKDFISRNHKTLRKMYNRINEDYEDITFNDFCIFVYNHSF